MTTWTLVAALVGYLFGSIPFGLVLTRLAGLGDIRNIGSGNIGATNVLRTGNRWLAAGTLILDLLKGTLAVLAGDAIGGFGLVAGAGAFLGHLFPVWLGFKGGKGFATYLGVLAAVSWQVAIVCALVWLAVAAISRFSSLAALTASLVTPFALYFSGLPRAVPLVFAAMTVILWLRHHENIRRLLAGSEGRIGEKK
jgi:glycerol-3-phosphate acyltransferase PlsY